ncbi:unnamed protein product, partial [Ectocarpus sp. 12 AP-2014]
RAPIFRLLCSDLSRPVPYISAVEVFSIERSWSKHLACGKTASMNPHADIRGLKLQTCWKPNQCVPRFSCIELCHVFVRHVLGASLHVSVHCFDAPTGVTQAGGKVCKHPTLINMCRFLEPSAVLALKNGSMVQCLPPLVVCTHDTRCFPLVIARLSETPEPMA